MALEDLEDAARVLQAQVAAEAAGHGRGVLARLRVAAGAAHQAVAVHAVPAARAARAALLLLLLATLGQRAAVAPVADGAVILPFLRVVATEEPVQVVGVEVFV